MNRRHFIKLISIFTAIFPFLRPKEYDSPNIAHAMNYDDPYGRRNYTDSHPYRIYKKYLPHLRKHYIEVLGPKWRKQARQALLEDYETKLVI